MTKELIEMIIGKLHKINFNVIAMVCDMGPSNMSLWRSLDISITKTFFEHPVTSKRIYIFADVPHLLKLARNHLLEKLNEIR